MLQPLEEIFLHSWAYPFALVSGGYNKLYQFIEKEGREAVERAKAEFGLTHQEAIHNLLFILGFNAFGGFSIFLPTLLNTILSDTTGLQDRLRKEVREKGGPTLGFDSVKEMELVKSVVYETLRLNPPVPLQYARARKDFQLKSHDSVFDVKKGEQLPGHLTMFSTFAPSFLEPEFDTQRLNFTSSIVSHDHVRISCSSSLVFSFRRAAMRVPEAGDERPESVRRTGQFQI